MTMMHNTQAHRPARRRGLKCLTAVASITAVVTAGLVGTAGAASASGSYQTTGTVNVRSGPGTTYGSLRAEPQGAGFILLCQWQGGTNVNGNATWDRAQFSDGTVGAISDYWTTTPSFNSYAPGTVDCNSAPAPSPAVTPQMQAAANWAIAEKNSPDPTWSDHYGHAWSGWCEEFVQQAEGFTFQFASALDNYNWQLSRGRIHTDKNPPVGALVFYSGGSYGHVAVSIGGGQEIGTYGYYGQRLPVRQYAVTGFLTNPYLGWSNPIGS